MKKFLLLIPVILVSLAVSATKTPVSPGAGNNIIRSAVIAANAGDTLVIADGEYTQGENYTVFNKNLIVMAADGANPIIKFTIPARIMGGARVEFIGIKFDMVNLHNKSWYDHLISVEDYEEVIVDDKKQENPIKVDGNKLIFDGCEFYNDTLNNSVIYCSSTRKIDSLIVKNCYFHDIMKSCIFLENTDALGVNVTNSTFANISTMAKYYAGVVDSRSVSGEMRVDHCTFYNCQAMSTDYADVKFVSTNALVSNCIFAMPTSTGGLRAIHMPDGREVKHTLVYNYTYDSGQGIRSGNTKTNCIFGKNPLFKNAASSDFTLYASSPARGAATDASTIGDPHFAGSVRTITIPETLLPFDVTLSTNAGVKQGSRDSIDLAAYTSKEYITSEWAKWKIKVTKAGLYKFTANVYSTNVQTYTLTVKNSTETSTFLTYNASGLGTGTKSFTSDNVELAVGEYVVQIVNTTKWSDGMVLDIVASYAGGGTVAIPGELNTEEVVLVPKKMTIVDDYIQYNDYGTDPTDEYAWWKIHATAGTYNVVFNIPAGSTTDHQYKIELLSDIDDVDPIVSLIETKTSGTGMIQLASTLTISSTDDYYIKLINTTKWSSASIRSIIIAPTVTISETATNLDALTDDDYVNAQLTRTVKGGMYNPLCLPFAVSASEFSRVFPGAELKTLTESSITDDILNLEFDDATSMTAGKPYLIKPASDVANPKFIGVTIDKTLNPTYTTKANFVGNTVVESLTASENLLYLGANDKLYWLGADYDMPGMRGWFVVTTPKSAIRGARIVDQNRVPTGIELVQPENDSRAAQKVIENGQVIIIRDNIRYNVQGQRIQ